MAKQADTFPTVSVIVTVYDRSQFLHNALRSVLEQKFRPFEIIVTDDSNKPEIQSICASFREAAIRYRANSSPVGIALNLRAAVSEARGRYIAILNDDDAWEPDFLETLVLPLESSAEIVLAFGDHWIMLADGEIDVDRTDENTMLYRRNTLSEGEILDWERQAILHHTIPLAMAAVFRKDAVDWKLLVGNVGGAYDFWISCLLASRRRPAYYVPRRLSRYRVHNLMETARRAVDKNENMVFVYAKLIELNLFPQLKIPLRERFQEALFVCGKDCLLFDRPLEGCRYFLRSLRISPNGKAVAGLLLACIPRRLRTSCIKRLSHLST
jgi:glycosyltransferase involved in cell wall biosynthesis